MVIMVAYGGHYCLNQNVAMNIQNEWNKRKELELAKEVTSLPVSGVLANNNYPHTYSEENRETGNQ